MKNYFPKSLKLSIRLIIRSINDLLKGYTLRFAAEILEKKEYPHSLILEQKILSTPGSANKVYNLKLAADKINKIEIQPNRIFSFWKIIGKPNKNNGFKKGRNIISGKITEDYGGGLCQLSGMIYYISLLSDLKILERHNHSTDIYTDKDRFAPLGSDATVVFGYKDLRILNNKEFPVRFNVFVLEDKLRIELTSPVKIEKEEISFIIENTNNGKLVKTTNKAGNLISISTYKKNL